MSPRHPRRDGHPLPMPHSRFLRLFVLAAAVFLIGGRYELYGAVPVEPKARVGAEPMKPGEPISPKGETIQLFNGKDFTGLYTWLKDTHYSDPRNVFTIVDGMVRISGEV